MNATQYNRLNELLSEFSTVSAALEAAEGEIKILQLAAATELLPKHADLKVRLTALEDELRKMADAHYDELFPEDTKRSHKTPFGEVKYHKSSSLEYADEEKALLKIKAACADERILSARAGTTPRFMEEQLVRKTEALNLDALGELDDITLAVFGITRARKDNFTVKPFAMLTDKPAKKAKAAKTPAALGRVGKLRN